MHIKIKYSIVLIAFCVSGCLLDDQDPENVSNINSELNLQLSQSLSPDGPELSFNIESVDLFDCQDATVESSLNFLSNHISLRIDNVDIPESCESGTYPAHGSSSIKVPDGSFPFTIDLHELTSQTGTINLAEDFFQIDFDGTSGVNILNNKIQLIPEGHVIGSLSSSNGTQNLMDFIIESASFIKVSPIAKEEDYGLFKIHDLDQIGEIDANNTLFVFHEVIDEAEFKLFVEKYRDVHSFVDISLSLSSGEEL